MPDEILDYFDLVNITKESGELHLYLDESNVLPKEYSELSLTGNGFLPTSSVKDFPLRDRKVVLHVRCRRWDAINEENDQKEEAKLTGTKYESFIYENGDTPKTIFSPQSPSAFQIT